MVMIGEHEPCVPRLHGHWYTVGETRNVVLLLVPVEIRARNAEGHRIRNEMFREGEGSEAWGRVDSCPVSSSWFC